MGQEANGELRMESDDMSKADDPYRYMIEKILPDCIEHFTSKSSDYGPHGFKDLGVKGQFSDIWRKVLKLKRTLWEDHQLHHEQPDEVLKDLFGHILITLYLLEKPSEAPDVMKKIWDDTGRCKVKDMHGQRCRLPVHSVDDYHLFPPLYPESRQPRFPMPTD